MQKGCKLTNELTLDATGNYGGYVDTNAISHDKGPDVNHAAFSF